MAHPPLQGKAVRDSFPMDWNSKMRIAGQLRDEAGPSQTTYFSFLKSGDLHDYTCTERLLGGQRGVMLKKPIGFCGRIHVCWEMHAHTWKDPEIYQIWIVNQANQKNWPKDNQKKCPIKVIQIATRVRLRDSPSESACVSIHTYCTLFPLNKHLLHYFPSLWKLFSAKLKGQGPCPWPLVLWLGSGSFTTATWP